MFYLIGGISAEHAKRTIRTIGEDGNKNLQRREGKGGFEKTANGNKDPLVSDGSRKVGEGFGSDPA